MDIGQKLRDYMQRNKMGVNDMSRKCGVDRSTISRLINRKRESCNSKTLDRINSVIDSEGVDR